MTWSEVTVLVVLVLLAALWWVWTAANRLDRLHRKVGGSRVALGTQLVRRASVAAELAASGCLDPVSSVLVGEAARSALASAEAPQEVPAELSEPGPAVPFVHAESELSATLRTALAEPTEVEQIAATSPGHEILEALAEAWYRVELARRFHNEAVAQSQRVRRKPLVRLLRLAGRARMPRTVEIDDAWPDALPRPGTPGTGAPPAGRGAG
ncbi:hypothetical protein [Cellulomonas bogoriensis]|uniref:NUDIX hydrolase n=1 Tax=Cellulomonas bogoriensis 69B4 = DSM 16987 TaxID=1386082 RepID=A0A0A0C2Z9_9CELL|nr:hypothetical protein [Cellulomonas bogoriensis]KGM13714.1 hypothetical protein N869_11295 [Cellulomonas bogoriensis 69B4 = DSM 16987]